MFHDFEFHIILECVSKVNLYMPKKNNLSTVGSLALEFCYRLVVLVMEAMLTIAMLAKASCGIRFWGTSATIWLLNYFTIITETLHTSIRPITKLK